MDDDTFASPFELWCEAKGLHPEQPGAWELYLQDSEGESGPRCCGSAGEGRPPRG